MNSAVVCHPGAAVRIPFPAGSHSSCVLSETLACAAVPIGRCHLETQLFPFKSRPPTSGSSLSGQVCRTGDTVRCLTATWVLIKGIV